MNLALLEDGLIVMIIGMGTVFIFLTIMIWAMDLNGRGCRPGRPAAHRQK